MKDFLTRLLVLSFVLGSFSIPSVFAGYRQTLRQVNFTKKLLQNTKLKLLKAQEVAKKSRERLEKAKIAKLDLNSEQGRLNQDLHQKDLERIQTLRQKHESISRRLAFLESMLKKEDLKKQDLAHEDLDVHQIVNQALRDSLGLAKSVKRLPRGLQPGMCR